MNEAERIIAGKVRKRNSTFKDIAGLKLGKLTVLKEVGLSKRHTAMWLCLCECGREKVVEGNSLRRGNTTSCGACHEMFRRFMGLKRHGKDKEFQSTFFSWQGMKIRCYCKNNHNYERYGGRGITVCDRWLHGEDGKHGFICFLEDMGPKPDRMTLDRKRVNEGYSPDNCRWATAKEQQNNRRDNVWLTWNGKTRTASQWESELGMSKGRIQARLRRGMPLERAMTPYSLKNKVRTSLRRT